MIEQRPPRRGQLPRPAEGERKPRPQGRPRPAPRGRPAPQGRPARRGGGGTLRLGRPRPRLRLVAVLLTLVLLAFVVRLFQVQVVDAPAYAAKADVNRYQPVEVAAVRGDITDRAGVPLATSVDAYDITADPYLFTPGQAKRPDAPQRAARLLAPVLGVDAGTLAARLATPKSRYVVLARRRSPQVWNRVKELKNAPAARPAGPGAAGLLAGVLAQSTSKRVYPAGDLAAGVIGFVNGENAGAGGLEAALNGELAGKPGRMTFAASGAQQIPAAGMQQQPAVPGADVELTIDRDIQWAAQNAITRQVEAAHADRGYVVVQDARNGQILAMADAPGFDPNDLTHADRAALGNAALQDAYEPGSVSKLVSMAAVLDQGVATPLTRVVVPGTLQREDRVFHDDVDHGTWDLTLNGVLAKSSNIGTILATGHLGRTQFQADQVLYDYLRKFGIGEPTGLRFPGETPGIFAPPQKWSTSQQYTIPFGQGLSVNAVQATSIYSTIADGGVRITPTLVKGTVGPDGRFTAAPAPKRTRVVSEQTARTLSRMLESVVGDEQGTGTAARIPGYRVAGKTGTANRVDPVTGRYHGYTASFMGFAPADNPRITVSCVVQNPTVGSYFGGPNCGPVFKEVMEFALKTLQVPPSATAAAPFPVDFRPENR
ncbi:MULTISPECIES: peptidoglycan D,D-transpeptidase FtsI family protein [Streptomycetaceae]|uniref:Cell division protein FtsI/penicillin-binding protein n=1 Tax=Streptantibioticus cattleyicolor (strain ATCC 35852 / DSM 46488 / JCM 4925 / NBRC 14057 / NRRL 8057) TaxID=1003195 RepID=F8JXV0_STREN|nr:penicillin-binding protein 2 [Streptantibioticus cattleyicolor]AEW93578.1 cell division protein FtsI/penicillin-binding protein [Streptantibioticus cattleyicolor NRRL 8057 = DSM 46488]MYS58283.1 cell division protein [Streptomyces sp. SID5468]CCB73927.1 putative cell division protein FtsI/penicillin-binding protein [Streptantibioticus cattleyicolor NRRL 8057 = DSM 46488]